MDRNHANQVMDLNLKVQINSIIQIDDILHIQNYEAFKEF